MLSATFSLVNRSQLPQDLVKSCLPDIIRHLKATSHVTHTYSAAAIDKVRFATLIDPFGTYNYAKKIPTCEKIGLALITEKSTINP